VAHGQEKPTRRGLAGGLVAVLGTFVIVNGALAPR